MANYFEASMHQTADVGKGSKRKLRLDVIIPLALEFGIRKELRITSEAAREVFFNGFGN
jgi:hypothetical protein